MMDSTAFQVFAIIALILQLWLLILALFQPDLPYRIRKAPECRLDSEEFRRILEILCDSSMHPRNSLETLTNGEQFYEAELDAIRRAQRSINLEAYIFQRGEVTRRFVQALAERARAGVQVKVVIDAIGSFLTFESYFKELSSAGGQVAMYHPLRWHTWPRINNRTHRELLIIDGRIGFVGGAGFADHWRKRRRGKPRWRDSMFRVEGPAVARLQSTFAENWLEASGEVLSGDEHFPVDYGRPGCCAAMVVNSTPSAGSSTRARILFQTLIASSQSHIHITTPYFLPDRSAREEMVKAIRERGVKIRIITPGKKSDHLLTRRASRRLYGELLAAGAEIYEYEPSMMHAKVLIVDGMWGVVGSTNFDHRSFGLNDEVNLAACDQNFCSRLQRDFAHDLAQSHAVTYEDWRRRPIWERAHEWLGWPLERQQ